MLSNNVLAGVADHDYLLNGMCHSRKLARDGGTHLGGKLCCELMLLSEGFTKLAHEIAALNGDFACKACADSAGQSLRGIAEIKASQYAFKTSEGRGQRYKVVQRLIGVGFLVGNRLRIPVAAVSGHNNLGAGVIDTV